MKGQSYAFRYRGVNEYGPSTLWSPVVYIIASDAPSQPPVPTLTSATDSDIALGISLPSGDGG
jgi:hypothetical protein